ncbi:MAG: hypothetical protein K8R44_03310 [Sulfurimonas sp.]|nr:hypothetical protein [Sulfurimonas sp.]
MFGKILGKNKKEANENQEHSKIVEKISKMNISDMRVYVNNKLISFEICEDGLNEVMRKLLLKDDKGQRFIEMDAMDSKKKKAFDLVLIVASSKKITIITIELIQEFMKQYIDIIDKFDKENKQIYTSKFKDGLTKAMSTISAMTEVNRKNIILGS